MDGTRLCEGRGPGSTPGEDIGFVNMTLEPDGQATGCKPVEVGSTPTSVSYMRFDLMRNFVSKHMTSSGQRRTGLVFDDWRRAFRAWNRNRGDVIRVVAHLVEQQDITLLVAGSTPVHNRRS